MMMGIDTKLTNLKKTAFTQEHSLLRNAGDYYLFPQTSRLINACWRTAGISSTTIE
jgi:hypothetical protein